MAGMTSHKVTVGVYGLNTQKTVYLQAGDPTDRYFTNIAWSPDSKTIYMFELNRKQNDCRLVSYNAETGAKMAELYRETSDQYVEPLHPILFLPWKGTKADYQWKVGGDGCFRFQQERQNRHHCIERKEPTTAQPLGREHQQWQADSA